MAKLRLERSTIKCLRMNIRQNDLRNVIIIPAAAGGENGTLELVSHHGWEAMAHSAALDAPWLFNTSTMGRIARCLMQRSLRHAHPTTATKRFVVQLMPLSRILEEYGVAKVNFLKIDCAGQLRAQPRFKAGLGTIGALLIYCSVQTY